MAGLLDVLTIGFQSEGLKEFETELKKTEKDLDEANKDVKALEQELKNLEKQGKKDSAAYKAVEKQLEEAREEVKKFENSVKVMQGKSEFQLLKLKNNFMKLTKTVAKFAAVGIAVKKSMQFYEEAEQLDFLAQKAGVAVEALQRLGNASQRYGGTTEGTAGTIETLRGHYTDIKTGKASDEVKKYGSLFTDNPEQTLENIAKKMETMKSETEKWDFANSIGIDEGTTRLLVQGVDRYREELKRTSKYKLYTKEDIERMKDYQQIQTDIRMGIQRIWTTVARLLLPSLTVVAKAIRAVTDWLAEHEGAVKIAAVFIGIAAAIGAVTGAVKILNAALKLLAANKVVLIFMAIAAAVTFVIALIQDFIVLLQGGESVIGKALEKCGVDVDKFRQNCLNFFNAIKEGVINAIEWFKSLGGKIAEFGKKLKSLWDNLPEPLKRAIGMVNPFTTFSTITTGKQVIEHYNKNKLNSVPQGAISTYNQTEAVNTNNNNNVTNINNARTKGETKIDKVVINTQAADAQGVARDLQSAVNYYDNGMAL